MNLPLLKVAENEHWDCHSCGACCRGTNVPLNADDQRKLREQQWDGDPAYQGQTIWVRTSPSGGLRLAHRPDGSCVFLTADNRCRIHEKFGAEAKPVVCRTFPLQLIPLEKQVVLTLRRACPSAAKDEGRPLAAHRAEVERLLAEGSLHVEPPTPPPLRSVGESSPDGWKTAGRTLAAAARIFGDERYPPVRRVVHAILFARLLEKVRVSKLTTRQFAEVIELLETSVTEEAKPLFAEPQPPGGAARLLFRLIAADHARLHPDYRPPMGFFARANLASSITRMALGRGRTPGFPAAFPVANFADLEAPLPRSLAANPRELQFPLERFLATSAATYRYALANRTRWSISQSIRALALTFPLALYLLRWTAVGREPTAADLALIISALDRGQGYAPLCGARYRTILQVLELQGELERLAVWYAR